MAGDSDVASELERLRQEYRDLEALLNRAPSVVFLWRIADGWPVEYVTDNVRQFGYEPDDFLTGRVSWPGITHPDDVPRLEAEVAGHMSAGRQAFDQSYRLTTRSGAVRWVQDHTIAVLNATGELTHFQGIITDVTERHLMEEAKQAAEKRLLAYQEQLRSLATQLAAAEERERRRIAVDLHDGVGQTLAVCKMRLDELLAGPKPVTRPQLDAIARHVNDAIRDTRTLTFELSPPVLYELGLGAALEWLAERTQEQHALKVELLGVDSLGNLGEGSRSTLFQAVREALMNVVKHARARRVSITVRPEETLVGITVEDDGIGFAAEPAGPDAGQPVGFGLFSMRERLQLAGGRFDLDSQPGRGTRLTVALPRQEHAVQDTAPASHAVRSPA